MAKLRDDQPLVPSVFDRLIDLEPTQQREVPRSRTQVLRELKQSVRRDLENLLNTRRRCRGWPPELTELSASLVNYGLPDITGADLAQSSARARFRDLVEEVVRQFEPRFTSVQVTLLENPDPLDFTLRFRIDAVLLGEPAPEPVIFDSVMRPATGAVEVKGAVR